MSGIFRAIPKLWPLMLGLLLGSVPLQEGLAQTPAVEDRVRVFFPKGDCDTGWIDVEVYNRKLRIWEPHAEHSRVELGTCQLEDPGVLLQELRVRCVDPGNRARVSEWRVGAEVFKPVGAEQCESE